MTSPGCGAGYFPATVGGRPPGRRVSQGFLRRTRAPKGHGYGEDPGRHGHRARIVNDLVRLLFGALRPRCSRTCRGPGPAHHGGLRGCVHGGGVAGSSREGGCRGVRVCRTQADLDRTWWSGAAGPRGPFTCRLLRECGGHPNSLRASPGTGRWRHPPGGRRMRRSLRRPVPAPRRGDGRTRYRE